MDELTKEFLAESLEGMDRMEGCLTELEQRPEDSALLAEIFRAVHTIKGATGFLGFGRLEKLAHAGETLLAWLRDGKLMATPRVIGALLRLMDRLREILGIIERTGGEGTRASDRDDELLALLDELNRAADQEGEGFDTSARVLPTGASSTPQRNEKTLRIPVEVLNRMMNLVGELVLTRNQMLQQGGESLSFPELARRLDGVTADLRETVMQARMQPVGHVFGKFPRMVRDLALHCGKSVRLEFCGQETGLDKSLLEAIKDPLAHAVRNAIDHGIEEPHVRALAGKPMEGLVQLRAYHHNGWVVVEVQDDGRGVSTGKVMAHAVECGMVTEEQAASMTERQALQLVFRPGFSTAAQVTNLSGRGVGLDVVRSNVEKIGGTVEMESADGKGTLLRLRVPLTLAIVRALVVRSGGQSFCVPQSALAELVYVPAREAERAVEWMGEAELYRLRERLLPMVRLDRVLGLDPAAEHKAEHGFYLVVLEADGCEYGLVVDELMVPEEIVVKPLSSLLRELAVFSGATVLGTGSLALILDVAEVGARAGVGPVVTETASREIAHPVQLPETSFLVFEDHAEGERAERRALPLTVVERIETVACRDVEHAGGRSLLQYRGDLLPLDDRKGLLLELIEPDDTATVLICQRAGRGAGLGQRVGLVVRRVVEVASGSSLECDAMVCPERLAVVNQRITSIDESFAESRLRDVA